MKLKCFCKAKEKINWVKRKLTEWEGIVVSHTSHKGLKSKTYEELNRVNTANGSFQKHDQFFDSMFSKEGKMAKKHLKKMSIIPNNKGNSKQNN